MSGDDSVFIKPPTDIRSKVSVGGPGCVDQAALARAEKVILEMAGSFVDMVQEDVASLHEELGALKANNGDAAILDKIYRITHDIKGQGGSFKYDLITTISRQLCNFIEGLKGNVKPADIEVIALHVDALQVVINQDLKGDGGEVGNSLLAGLEKVIAKRTNGQD